MRGSAQWSVVFTWCAIVLVLVLPLTFCSTHEGNFRGGSQSGAFMAQPGAVVSSGYFVENRGQFANPEVRFAGAFGPFPVAFGESSVLLNVPDPEMRSHEERETVIGRSGRVVRIT